MSKLIDQKDICLMSQKERSKVIAQDVIAQILAKTYAVTSGSYVTLDNHIVPDSELLGSTCEISSSYLQQSKCAVCAKGAVYLAGKLRNKSLVRSDLNPFQKNTPGRLCDVYTPIRRQTLNECQIFDTRTYDLLEIVFEGQVVADAYDAVCNFDHPLHAEWMDFKRNDQDAGDWNDDLDRTLHGTSTYLGRAIENFEHFTDPEDRLLAIMLAVVIGEGEFDPMTNISQSMIDGLRKNDALRRKRVEAANKAAQTRRTNKLMLEIAKADRAAERKAKKAKKAKKGKRK
jgi:hypothetical protein